MNGDSVGRSSKQLLIGQSKDAIHIMDALQLLWYSGSCRTLYMQEPFYVESIFNIVKNILMDEKLLPDLRYCIKCNY